MTDFDLTFIEEAARKECFEVAEEIALEANRTAPIDTGDLSGSSAISLGYHTEFDEDTGGAKVVPSVDYWKYVEYGHHIPMGKTPRKTSSNGVQGPELHGFVAAQPHVRPAIEYVRKRNT